MKDYLYISIIIPHYNIPVLLERCLNSIPKRDDVQVIVIDDCSNDGNRVLIKQMEEDHPQTTFIYMEENGGGGKARNIGLSHANGRYVLFADADDFFNECLSSVLEDYKNTDYDQLFFKANSVDSDTLTAANRADHLNRYIDDTISGKDTEGRQLRYLFGEPWARMVKRSVIEEHNIRFEETPIHNDTAFAYLTGFYSKSIHVDERELYCVTVRKGSVSRVDDLQRILTRIEVFSRAELFLSKHEISTFPVVHYWQLAKLLTHGHFQQAFKGIAILQRMGHTTLHILYYVLVEILKLVKLKLNTI